MNWHKRTARVGILAVITAMLFRFAGSSIFGSALGVFAQPELASFLIYSETGRKPALPEPNAPQPSAPPEQTSPDTPTQPPIMCPVFSSADAGYLDFRYSCSYRPDPQALVLQPLQWDLTVDEPSVLIIHTHGTEAYTQTPDAPYYASSDYRTSDDRYNVISIGDELTRLLEEAGLTVIHDRTAYDLTDYESAYSQARAAAQAYLKQYPSIKMVLDLHRDAAQNTDGSQWASCATVNGERSAQLMFVVGTDAMGDRHPNWMTNLSIAGKLNVLMEKSAPGICRSIDLRGKRYNHDLAMGAMIVEVGSAGNTHSEAMRAIPVLADAIIALARGTQ